MTRSTASELSQIARAVADRVRQGPVRWQGDVIAFDGDLLYRQAAGAATPALPADEIARQALSLLEYWVASEPFAFDDAGLAWRRQHDALLRQIRTLRAWAGNYRQVQSRLARLNFELDGLLTREGNRRADAENAALERGDVIPCRVILVAA